MSVIDVFKQIIVWVWKNKEKSLVILLLIIVGVQTKRFYNSQEELEKQIIERGNLPDNIEFVAELKGTKFAITYRDSKNNIVHKDYFVPKEGGLKFTKYVDLKKYDPNSGFNGQSIQPPKKKPIITNPVTKIFTDVFGPKTESGETNVNVVWYGFTFRPGIAVMYNGRKSQDPATAALDTKLFFVNRYSMGVGSSLDYPYIWGSRHVDDIIPFIPVENLEVMCGYGKPYDDFGGSVFTIGGRTNF